MKQFRYLFKKEFLHVWRDRRTMLILFGMPLVQILIFGFALTNEVKNSGIGVMDLSHSETSAKITSELKASRYFDLVEMIPDHAGLLKAFRNGSIKLAVVFPGNFQNQLAHDSQSDIQLIGDATDPNNSNTLIYYATAVIMDYKDRPIAGHGMPMVIKTDLKYLYNPQLKGSYNFVPGVIAMVLMLVCAMMTSISIVKEKEMGTMEVILVSPVRPILVILAKMVPYFLLSALNIGCILLLSVFVLKVPIEGNLMLLIGECLLFTITVLALGLLISSATNSQQIAMLISLMGMFLPTIMLSGFMFPIENMPVALRVISNVVPAKWFYFIVKSIMIKGVGIKYIWKETLILVGMTLFFMVVSIRKFKTRLE